MNPLVLYVSISRSYSDVRQQRGRTVGGGCGRKLAAGDPRIVDKSCRSGEIRASLADERLRAHKVGFGSKQGGRRSARER